MIELTVIRLIVSVRPARVLVCWCPDWPVLAVGADPDAPVAVLVGEGARRIVAACSSAARVAGVRRGQRVRDAQRLCPQLEVHRRDEAGEAREFEPVATAVEELAAGVEVIRPGLLALDARGPARYHGGEQRLAALVRDAVAELSTASGSSVGCGVGIADGVFAATLAARSPGAQDPVLVEPGGSAAFLAGFPPIVLGDPELADALERLGIHTLGKFAALPAAGVVGRFGAAGTTAHRLALGLDPRPPAPRRPAEDLGVAHEFDPAAEQDEPVVFTAKALADRLHRGLAGAGLACVRLGVEVTTVSGRSCFRLWRHADPLGARLSALAVAERVRWQLDGWRTRDPQLEIDPVAVLRLLPDQLVVDVGSQQALWGGPQTPDRVGRAAERVQAILGQSGVLRPRLVGGRDPAGRIEYLAWGDLPEVDKRRDAGPPTLWPGAVPWPAPSVVPRPYPVELRDADGVPVTVTGRAGLTGEPALIVLNGTPGQRGQRQLRVTGWAGPWLYDERWWDSATRRRCARLQCATSDGRVFLLAAVDGTWQVEGIYQ
jgi:protein ImuB